MNMLDDIHKLRELTGCGLMECKKALDRRRGITEFAIEYLERNGLAVYFGGNKEERERSRYPKWYSYLKELEK